VPVQPRGEWQENSIAACDTGTSIKYLTEEYPQFDFNTVCPEWPAKTGLYAFTEEAIARRGRECRAWLKARPEKVIAVVSHSAFLRVGISHYKWANADYRIFEFADDGDQLVQWQLTEKRGGGMGRSPKEPIYPSPSDFELWQPKDKPAAVERGGE
jgi:broad specificity phosphatase PhoE